MKHKYGYGSKLDARIEADALILADLYKLDKIDIEFLRTGADNGSYWNAFTEAGGDDSRSGFSFAMVRARALELLSGEIGNFTNPAIMHIALDEE